MSKYKNEDANDASPFKKTLFYAAFLADITPRPGKMHHRSRKHRLDDASASPTGIKAENQAPVSMKKCVTVPLAHCAQ